MPEDGDDVVLFYFSGHGYNAYWPDAPSESLIELTDGTSLKAHNLNEVFGEFASEKIVFIFDCCGSGGFIYLEENLAKNGRIILASSDVDQASWQYLNLKSSLFTYYLLRGLSGPADDDYQGEDGYLEVSAQEVFYYAEPKVRNYNTPKPQEPQIYDGIGFEVKLTEY